MMPAAFTSAAFVSISALMKRSNSAGSVGSRRTANAFRRCSFSLDEQSYAYNTVMHSVAKGMESTHEDSGGARSGITEHMHAGDWSRQR